MTLGLVIARIVWVYAAIGLGIGLGLLIFLWTIDYFQPPDEGFEAIGDAVLGGFAITGALTFVLLVGVVIAGLGGGYAAHTIRRPSTALIAGAVGASIGHALMVAVFGVLVISGMDLLSSGRTAAAVPTPSPQTEEEREACEQLFGAGSAACAPQESVESTTDPDLEANTVLKLALGLIPAAVVGSLSASFLAPRATP